MSVSSLRSGIRDLFKERASEGWVWCDGDDVAIVHNHDDVDEVERRLERFDPDYEWAIIGVDDDGDYEVTARPTGT